MPATSAQEAVPPALMAQYNADAAKTILELLPFRREQEATGPSGLKLRLVSLNPRVNA